MSENANKRIANYQIYEYIKLIHKELKEELQDAAKARAEIRTAVADYPFIKEQFRGHLKEHEAQKKLITGAIVAALSGLGTIIATIIDKLKVLEKLFG